jgi:AcrR family transcriptional regulator
MKEPLRQRKKARTHQAIVDTATRLFRKRGFDSTTLEEIADGADVHKQTVLRYFKSKEEIAFASRIRIFEDFRESLSGRTGTVLEHWRKHIETASRGAMKTGELVHWYDFIDGDTRLFAFQLRLNERYQTVLAEAFSAEAGVDPNGDLFARVLSALLVAGNSNVARMTVRNGDMSLLSRNVLAVVDLAAQLKRPASLAEVAVEQPTSGQA